MTAEERAKRNWREHMNVGDLADLLRAHANAALEEAAKVAESLRGRLPEPTTPEEKKAHEFIREVETLHGKAIAAAILILREGG